MDQRQEITGSDDGSFHLEVGGEGQVGKEWRGCWIQRKGGTRECREREKMKHRGRVTEPCHWCGTVPGAGVTRMCQRGLFLERLRGQGSS